ncbi:hypothetical protein JOD29_003262 [Lysinibacillus composti]|uniref:S-layer homology domain-containing protein n=1 Tax=Lysinibacillus composti TaxID=720633 RepID=A0A3N9UA34_9BACI|nr:S-layer homology domain-containing protein [Lysinibacillus composti]MBM7609986.1 hypothetical protein [Lysinibacillus composti]RQW73403.1 S-layer homology domain-containing protein [Lysinibacillus composti]
MKKRKKLGIVLTSAALSIGLFSSVTQASVGYESIQNNGQPEKLQIQVADTNSVVSKDQLIKKLKELFPKKFDFLSNKDFTLNSSVYYPENETIRYDLSFNKTVSGKMVHGYASFVGKDLELENFYYEPPNQADALFPAKVSKEEAQKKATELIKKFPEGEKYQLEEDVINYYSSKILTEPVRYTFSYVLTKNDVPISDERIEVTVLGNGEVINFYRNIVEKKSYSFDDIKKIKAEKDVLKNVKDNLEVELQYQIEYDYATNDRTVQLIYKPMAKVQGVQALTGDWQTTNGFTSTYPAKAKIEKLASNPLPPKQDGVTIEQAKKIAEQTLKIDSEKVKLVIQSIEELENFNGQQVISINYMYEYKNGGYGTNIEIDKNTGEIIQYHNIKNEILKEVGEVPKNTKEITQAEALTKAISYVKQWVPSYTHNYAKPINEPYIDENQGVYYFSFPRVVNNIVVSGDEISVSIGKDGTLMNLYVNYQEIGEWPSLDKVIAEKQAETIIKDALSLKLNYVHLPNVKQNYYSLVYTPYYNGSVYNSLDAITGKWYSPYTDEVIKDVISHPWAQDELNYLINADILEVKDVKTFNADAPMKKGEALKVLMTSLTYFYEQPITEPENSTQSFENISPEHPLYSIVERAVSLGVLNPSEHSFNPDAKITRQELASWYIRVLGLEQAGKFHDIYKLNFSDANSVQKEYIGYVALANSLGLIKAESNQFSPNRDVTYAELAASTILLAHAAYENGSLMYRHY